MKNIFYLFIIILSVSCAEKKLDIATEKYLTTEQQKSLKYDVVRYIEKLPKYANKQNKFDTIFDKPYRKMADSLAILFAYKNTKTDTLYFAIAKKAPSLKIKKTSTLGKLVYDKNQKITFYEESYRTWKMEVPELQSTTEMLFQKYIQNRDLSEYYTKNSKGKYIIEFPDEYSTYDTNNREWKFNGSPDLIRE